MVVNTIVLRLRDVRLPPHALEVAPSLPLRRLRGLLLPPLQLLAPPLPLRLLLRLQGRPPCRLVVVATVVVATVVVTLGRFGALLFVSVILVGLGGLLVGLLGGLGRRLL